ncbi:hypothetical protein KEM52_003278, partial [Ascosphaera acerosa]
FSRIRSAYRLPRRRRRSSTSSSLAGGVAPVSEDSILSAVSATATAARPASPKLAGSTCGIAGSDGMQIGLPPSKARLLEDALFPPWERSVRSTDPQDEDPSKLQQDDPLATKIWRMYSRTKSQLAGQERVENLTWRMMSMTLQKERANAIAQGTKKQRQQPESPSPVTTS